MDKVKNTSVNTGNENLDKLRRVFPQFVKENKIDFEALNKFFKDEEIVAGEEKYGLNWAGKSNAFKLIRTPSIGTLTPQEKESKDWDKTENLFIEGDNLEVLKLLQKHYREKIKMIYIDPPYNTGKDFIYKDNYTENISDYYEKTGQSKDGIKMTTNPESAGRYHSDWLTMMYPRLFLARNLLQEDGVIFISIDDNEVANLRLIMDEIFGEENFLAQIIWANKEEGGSSDSKHFRIKHEYILVYAKNFELLTINGVEITNIERYVSSDKYIATRGKYYLQKLGMGTIQYSQSLDYEIVTPDKTKVTPKENNSGKKACWRWSKKKLEWGLINGFIEFKKDKKGIWQVYTKQYLNCDNNGNIIDRKQRPFGIIDQYSSTQASKDLQKIFGVSIFEYSKPVNLIAHLIKISTEENEIILDFFAGSGTTAHAVMELNAEDGGNRKWICVQLPEATDEDSEAYKAGYKNIAEIARERIRRAGKKINKGDVDFKSLSLSKSNYRQWNLLTDKDDENKLIKQMKVFLEKPLVDEYDEKSVVYEILLKEGYNPNSKVTQEKSGNIKYWQVVNEGKKLLVTFEKKITKDQVESLKLTEEDTFVCLDSALDDTTKINIGRNLTIKVI